MSLELRELDVGPRRDRTVELSRPASPYDTMSDRQDSNAPREDIEYVAWSPYSVASVCSPAKTAPADASEERLASIAGSELSYVPIPAADEYYDAQAGERRPLAPEQFVSPDHSLLAAVGLLAEHPFLLVEDREGADGPTYRILTRADLNRRTAEAAIYPVISTLADHLAALVESEHPDSASLVPVVGPFPVGAWTKARSNDVDVHIAEFLSLTDMLGVLKGNDRLLSVLGYDDPDELESDLYAVVDLRNRVMHGNRSLVMESGDVATDYRAIRTAIDLASRIERFQDRVDADGDGGAGPGDADQRGEGSRRGDGNGDGGGSGDSSGGEVG